MATARYKITSAKRERERVGERECPCLEVQLVPVIIKCLLKREREREIGRLEWNEETEMFGLLYVNKCDVTKRVPSVSGESSSPLPFFHLASGAKEGSNLTVRNFF
eukprot:TRINITY_DN10509_c1_g1_i1.p1 TRINITY_DN10509_c1_g1~~TRINITY_DN10509_c1_g1_i1.p1  ORF type:complete len:106 (+),score=23.43 TRINITY_DN10509_c1_g1_i1:187-504(+)